jgi:hypothetical protein
MKYLNTLLLLALVAAAHSSLMSQTIGGVVNIYTPVTAISGCANHIVTVGSSAGFAPGDEIMLIQMQGETVDLSNSLEFGNILGDHHTGVYELNRIKNIQGNQIELVFKTLGPYEVSGKVQMIRVPEYDHATVTSPLTCLPWNGATGGVLVIDVSETLTLQNNINVNGKGFRGGLMVDANAAPYGQINFFYPPDPIVSSSKGEGVALIPFEQSYGRGKAANGGGGGNSHNGGGGGGGNAGKGGFGGLEYFNTPGSPSPGTNGIGGLNWLSNNDQRLLLGGGGGAGHVNDNHGTSGGTGGGIILLKVNMLVGNGFKLMANGDNVLSSGTDRNDGQGGGGAGGTVMLYAHQITGGLNCELKGGFGGDCPFYVMSQIIGPGGGGGGGKLLLSQNFNNISWSINGGKHGFANQNMANGATDGEEGSVIDNVTLIQASLQAAVEQYRTISLCPGQPILLNGQIHTAPDTVVVTTPGLNGVCDTLTTYRLTLTEQFTNTQTIPLCANETIVIGGQVYTAPATVQFVSPGFNGDCDTLTTFHLSLVSSDTITQISQGVCAGETIEYQGVVLQAGDIQTFTLSNWAGCDSLVTLTVFQKNNSSNTLLVRVCPGNTYPFMGQNIAPGESHEFQLINSEGCDSTLTIVVAEYPTTSFLVENTPSCPNTPSGQLYIHSISGGPAPYRFSLGNIPFQEEALFEALEPGNYAVFVQDSNGCISEQTLQMPSLPELEVYLANAILPCDSPQVRLQAIVPGSASNTLEYRWWNGALSAHTFATEAGTVWVEVTDVCQTLRTEAAVQWAALANDPEDIIYVPNIFSPTSNDPDNAQFKPYFSPKLTVLSIHFEIFDRWGNKLFETNNPSEAWGGMFRAKDINPGIHVWHLEAELQICGRVLQVKRKGDVMVIR